jgi:hypothetical protein
MNQKIKTKRLKKRRGSLRRGTRQFKKEEHRKEINEISHAFTWRRVKRVESKARERIE